MAGGAVPARGTMAGGAVPARGTMAGGAVLLGGYYCLGSYDSYDG